MGFIIFLTLFLSIYGAMNGYVIWSLGRGFGLSWSSLSTALWALGTSSYILGSIIARKTQIHWPLSVASYWMGILSFLLCVLLLKDILSFLTPASWQKSLHSLSIVLALSLSVFAIIRGAQTAIVRPINIQSKLPDGAQELRLLLLSDLHLNPRKSLKRLIKTVELANRQKADLIVITGDLIDEGLDDHPEYAQELGKLSAPLGVLGVTGNHEYYLDSESYRNFYKQANIQLLENSHVPIAPGFSLAGINDPAGKRIGKFPDFDQALQGVPEGHKVILLNHTPEDELIEEALRRNVFLTLGGHTHAGQIPPMSLLVRLAFRYVSGLYTVNEQYVYTSCGTSTWGPPMRLSSRNEMALISITDL